LLPSFVWVLNRSPFFKVVSGSTDRTEAATISWNQGPSAQEDADWGKVPVALSVATEANLRRAGPRSRIRDGHYPRRNSQPCAPSGSRAGE
jgi:hypothetical protein